MADPGVDEKTSLTAPEPYTDAPGEVEERPGTPDQPGMEIHPVEVELASNSADVHTPVDSSPEPGTEVQDTLEVSGTPTAALETPNPPPESDKDAPSFASPQPTQGNAELPPPSTVTSPTDQQPQPDENQPVNVGSTPVASNLSPDLDPRNHQVLDRPPVFASPDLLPQGGPPPSQGYGTIGNPAAGQHQQLQYAQQQGAPVQGQYGQQYTTQQQQYYQQPQQYNGQQQPPPGHHAGQLVFIPPPESSQRTVKVRSPNEYEPLITTCPQCHSGTFSEQFSLVGILLAIFCFPCGIICCVLMKEKRCSHCGLII